MRRTTAALVIGGALAVAVAATWFGSARRGATAPPTTSAAAPAASAPVAVELLAADLATAVRVPLVRQVVVSGALEAVSSAVVKARVAAEVRVLTVREGDRVVAGQRLGSLDDTEFRWRLRQAEDQIEAARAQREIAERTLANNRALVDQGFISRNALDTSSSNAAAALASLRAAEAAAEIARKAVRDTEITSPIAGLVAARHVQPGERVGLDARIVEVVDLSRIEMEAAIAPEEVGRLAVGQAARVRVEGLAAEVPARVVRIAPAAAAGTRAVMAYLALDPVPGLRQGLFARGAVEVAREAAIVVPAGAVRHEAARPHVLVVVGGAGVPRVQAVNVVPGDTGEAAFDGGAPEPAVAITAGLEPGARVLRAAVGALRPETPVRLPLATPAADATPSAPQARSAEPAPRP